ncbi:TetR/AcrR family transcriptional regulator [uncultured Clostridium sp.]|uniref:TetR/AcrR family transcriptional regulator n=1 Tax=uncultured Clostridium sp. TaxID=59620 RepID=UPI002608149E|nr:TetR/AcrR family transcriptional regulator [uncultured Clostridium sp.]
MEPKLSKKEQGQLTKAKIFKTAVDLISTHGYKNVTVDKICLNAEVSKGGFYVHYKSKEDIIRESYYINMEEYIIPKYKDLLLSNELSSTKEKIKNFLLLQLEFSKNIGYEITCLAYTLNLNECSNGLSHHLEKRTFSNNLKDLLILDKDKLLYSIEDSFLYLESSIRGLMASWCFSNNTFDIYAKGLLFIDVLVSTIYR